jgi:hypothetical protein
MLSLYIHQKQIHYLPIKHLISYQIAFLGEKFKSFIFVRKDIPNIENNRESFFLFSICTPDDLYIFDRLIDAFRTDLKTIDFNIVIGGTLLYAIDSNDLLKFYPEISFICIGKGEEFLLNLFSNNNLPFGIYHAHQFSNIRNYRIADVFLNKNSIISLTFNDNRCSWGKCMFCHHSPKSVVREKNTSETIAEDIIYYKQKHQIRNFYIYDNETNPNDLKELLISLQKKSALDNVYFDIFGIRIGRNYSGLIALIKELKYNPLNSASWGVEFYCNEILELYQKGITTEDVDVVLEEFHNIGVKNKVFLLLGLPMVNMKNIQNHLRIKDKAHLVHEFRTSFFRLSEQTRIWNKKDNFRIQTQEPYEINDLSHNYTFPKIETKYFRFLSLDPDTNQWFTRKEVYEKYNTADCLFNLNQYPVIKNI